MLYLVKMASIESVTAGMSPQQMTQFIEQLVLPTMEIALKLEAQKKVLAGGNPVGTRGGVFIIEAASNTELDEILTSLPLWGVTETTVVPLESFKSRAATTRKMLEKLKALK